MLYMLYKLRAPRKNKMKKAGHMTCFFIFEIYGARTRGLHRDRVA